MTEPLTTTANAAGGVALVTAMFGSAAPVLGTTAELLLVACAGVLFGLAHTKPEHWAKFMAVPEGHLVTRAAWVGIRAGGLAFTLASNAVATTWAVQALPHIPLLAFMAQVPPVAATGLIAYASQRLIPLALEFTEAWVRSRKAKVAP